MKRVLDYILSVIYVVWFGLILVIFHGIQAFAYNIFGQKAHQKTVEWMNFLIVYGWYFTGSGISFNESQKLGEGTSKIFIANHQSMFDIPGIIWFLRKQTPLFISKKELSKGIPGISYNLRAGKAALIDRNDPKQAIAEIIRFATYVKEKKFSAVIFPEGTRSRTGKLKPFAVGGVATLIKKIPNAEIVPIAIKNTGKFNPTGIFPLRSFVHMSWTTLNPIDKKGKTPEEITREAEYAIKEFLGQ